MYDENGYYGNTGKKRGAKKIAAAALAVLLLVTTLGGGMYLFSQKFSIGFTPKTPDAGLASQTTGEQDSGTNAAPINNEDGSFMSASEIYANYVDAMVTVTTEGQTSGGQFGRTERFTSSGSGFVVTGDGYVVTNQHVVENGSKFTVAFPNGKTYEAKLVGAYADNDTALLKIEASGLKTVKIGDSGKTIVGEDIVVIGSPLGELIFSLSKGVVSALDREIRMSQTEVLNMFQIDAAVNPGNSGGPVFNAKGEVIGVVTAKNWGENIEGLGFALPINGVMEIVNQLKESGYIKGRPSLGIMVSDAYTYDWSGQGTPAGVLVSEVTEGSAAEKAGLRENDVITKVGKTEVKSVSELAVVLQDYKAGDSAELTIIRDSDTITVNIVFDEKTS